MTFNLFSIFFFLRVDPFKIQLIRDVGQHHSCDVKDVESAPNLLYHRAWRRRVRDLSKFGNLFLFCWPVLVLVPSCTPSSQFFVRSTWNESWILALLHLVKRSKEKARLTTNPTKKGSSVVLADKETIRTGIFRRVQVRSSPQEAISVSGRKSVRQEKNCERILSCHWQKAVISGRKQDWKK